MSGGAWGYLAYKLRDGEIPLAWLPTIFGALADVEHLMDWAVSLDTSKEAAMPEVWDRLVTMFDAISDHTSDYVEWPVR